MMHGQTQINFVIISSVTPTITLCETPKLFFFFYSFYVQNIFLTANESSTQMLLLDTV